MGLPLRRPLAIASPAPAPRRRLPARTLRQITVLAVCTAFGLGALVPYFSYWAGYDAGQRAADEDAVYRGVGDAVRLGVRVALRSDSLTHERRAVATKAAQQLPPHVLDSLRNVRWTTPP